MLLCEPGYQTTVFLVTCCYVNQFTVFVVTCCYVNQDIKLLFEPGYKPVFLVICYVNQDIKLLFS